MDYGDHYWGLYRDYYRDPFPHSLLSTRKRMADAETAVRSTWPTRLLFGAEGLGFRI